MALPKGVTDSYEFLGKLSKILNILALATVVISIAAKLWMNYSRKLLDLEMDMCDLNGNAIHVTVDAVLYLGLKKPWNWKFKGEICYDDKVFKDWGCGTYLIPLEIKTSGKSIFTAHPKEWINAFRFREKKGETYLFYAVSMRI